MLLLSVVQHFLLVLSKFHTLEFPILYIRIVISTSHQNVIIHIYSDTRLHLVIDFGHSNNVIGHKSCLTLVLNTLLSTDIWCDFQFYSKTFSTLNADSNLICKWTEQSLQLAGPVVYVSGWWDSLCCLNSRATSCDSGSSDLFMHWRWTQKKSCSSVTTSDRICILTHSY